MLPKLESQRGSSMEFSSGIRVDIRKNVEEGLEEEVERRVEKNTQEQPRMSMTMDGNEDTQTRLEPM